MSTSTPPPSSLQRAVELDRVRDVMLLENEEQMRVEPIPPQRGEIGPRAKLEAQLRACRVAADLEGERVLSLELARIHFENAFDVDMAVQLLHRALEIQDDGQLRAQLARQLAAMGRHIEAGHVLRDGEPADALAVFNAWLGSGEAYARGGDAEEAVATFRETAMIAPDDPTPFARIASIAYWAGGLVPRERAADAWLEAAKRQPPGSAEHFRCVLRAFEVAPAYARSAETYTTLLVRTGRPAEADEVWRIYAKASDHVAAVAKRRAEVARSHDDHLAALCALIEEALAVLRDEADRAPTPLDELLGSTATQSWLEDYCDDVHAFAQRLQEAVATPSSATRGERLTQLGGAVRGEVGATLLAIAAECYLEAGEPDHAVALAREACRRCPWLTRAQSSLFAAAEHGITMAELERALAALPAHSGLYDPLAERCAAAGRHDLALVYTRRVVELRPGDRVPLESLLRRAAASEHPEVVAEAMVQVVTAARPWRELGPALAKALDQLATLDPRVALEAAGHVLATVGPGDGELFSALRRIAARAQDAVVELAATLGRAIGDEIDDEDRAAVYLEAVDLSLAYGDVEAAAVHASRAAAHSGPLEQLEAAIDKVTTAIGALDGGAQSDARVSLARARAWAAEQRDVTSAVESWRVLGAMRWDLAADSIGAEEAFYVACSIEPDTGPYRYASDLSGRAGAPMAVPLIVERAVNAEHDGAEPALVAKLYAAAARVAADEGMAEAALDAAVAAVRTDPSRADAVAIVESIAEGDAGMQALNFVYDTLADAALGRYGYRAAHYRAARQLEKLTAYEDALRHAVNAFEAVPSVGASYAMLLRLAARAGNEAAAVNALTSVAASFPIDGKVAWLLRASEVAQKSGVGASLRLELLLKAFSLSPSVDLVTKLGAIGAELVADGNDRASFTVERLERAAHAALEKLEGALEAPVAIALGVFAGKVLVNPALSAAAVRRAVELDRHDADYEPVLACVEAMAEAPEAARSLLRAVNEARANSDRPLAPGLKELTSKLYLSLSDLPPPSRPSEGAVLETPTPSPTAERPADSSESTAVRPPDDLTVEHETEERGPDSDSLAFDEHLANLEDPEPRPSDPDGIVKVTLPSHRPSAPGQAEAPPPSTPTDGPASDEPRPSAPADSSPRRAASDEASEYGPESEAAARRRGDHAAIADMLAKKIAVTENLEQRRIVRLRRAAVLEQRLGRLEEACRELDAILEECGEDPTALRYLADLSERRGYHARGAKLWLRASQRATDVDEKIRDVVRCCEALVADNRLETAKKLLEAARGLPQSPKLLRLRVAVARRMGDRPEVERAKRELEALDPTVEGISHRPEPSDPAPDSDVDARFETRSSLPAESGNDAGIDEAVARITDPEAPHDRPAGPFARIARPRERPTPAARPSSAPPVSSRSVFRVTGVPPDEDDELTPAQVLEDCHRDYVEHGAGGAREAKRLIRRLRSIGESLAPQQRDLYTFLLVEALDAAQGTGAANHALQQHWETLGGTPLVTMAVADRLVRRGDLKPALQLYRRVLERDLRGVRSHGEVALDAASVAWRLGDRDAIDAYLELATEDPRTADLVERRREQFRGPPPPVETVAKSREVFQFRWDASTALREPSRVKTDSPKASDAPPAGTDSSIPPGASDPPEHDSSEVTVEATIQALDPNELVAMDDDLDDLDDELDDYDGSVGSDDPQPPDLDERADDEASDPGADDETQRLSEDVLALDPSDGDVIVATDVPPPSTPPRSSSPPSAHPATRSSRPPSLADRHSYPPGHQRVEHITSRPPAPSENPPQLVSVVRRIPTFPQLVAPNEEQLFDELLSGEVVAGDQLVALFDPSRTHDVLSVRRYQATLLRGDVEALRRLRDAAIADQAGAFARAVDHVLSVFDPSEGPKPAAPLNQLPAQPDNTKKLLFSWLDGTVNEALALVCESGMVRRELSDYELTGADRVPPVATTAVGRVYAAMTRLLDLGVRLFHRQRSAGPLRTKVALVSPLSAILEGEARDDSAELSFTVASALAAATPAVALVESLDDKHVRNIVAALRAGFGPVEEHSVTASTPEQMRIAEDLWHMVPAAADRRLRTICRDTHAISYEIAVANAESTQRRAGLFGCGDLEVAIRQTQRELDLPPGELHGEALRELCQHPAIADLYDLAILPEYAEARWTA